MGHCPFLGLLSATQSCKSESSFLCGFGVEGGSSGVGREKAGWECEGQGLPLSFAFTARVGDPGLPLVSLSAKSGQ